MDNKPGRNDPCPCGSGKKFKKCCSAKFAARPVAQDVSAKAAPSPAECQQLVELFNAGRHVALESQSRLLAGKYPESGFAWKALGAALLAQGKEALPVLQKAARLLPDDAEAHSSLGNALQNFGQFDAAVASYRRALEIQPDFANGHYNLGIALHESGKLDAAAQSYRRALGIKPDFVEAHINLGNVLRDLGKLDDALQCYRRALEIRPDSAMVHCHLGNVLKNLGQLDEAVASYRRALEIKPDYALAYSNLLYLHAFTRDIPPEQERSLAAGWEKAVLDAGELAAARGRSFENLPRSGRKLRVGIVSAELGQHPVAEFLEPILEQLDRSRFHVTLFPTVVRAEARAVRIRGLADEYKPLDRLSDRQAADLIASERIDILIDTTSHMAGCRLGIFARRAAPVQCHYIGYHGTTGLTEMDWLIADGGLLPSGYDAHFCEGVWRLPRLRLAYKGDALLPESRWAPGPDGAIWLGSFNNLTKVREEALGLWARVMQALPEAKLLLKDRLASDPAVQQRIHAGLGRHGIAAERVEFVGTVPDWAAHMALYDRLDIALDSIPLNSETTAFDALWMGVPLIALEGSWYGGRMASTILKAFGKPEWVARDEDEYVAKVAALARDVAGRKSLRTTQRAAMADSPLCDARGLARALENAFEAMFDRWMAERGSIGGGSGAA